MAQEAKALGNARDMLIACPLGYVSRVLRKAEVFKASGL